MRKFLILAGFLAALPLMAATATPIQNPHVNFFDSAGAPCAGCSLYTYAAGTTTPQATYTDSSEGTQNTNPVILGVDGGAYIWFGSNGYKMILKDTGGATIWTVDNVLPSNSGGSSIQVNGVAVTGTPNFNDTTPTAGVGYSLVKWQKDVLGNISAEAATSLPNAPAFSVQLANNSVNAFASDPNVTVDTTNHIFEVGGAITGNYFNLKNLGVIPATWTFDVTTPRTALASLGSVPLSQLSTQAADTVVMNAGGSTAVPTAVGMPTSCSNGVNYNTSTHTWSCAATTRTCGANGCYITHGDGTIEAWGNSTLVTGTPTAQTLTITFPTSYTTTTNLSVNVTSVADPAGDGNPHPSDCHIVRSSLSTSGLTVIISTPTQVGGSGYSNLVAGDYCSWHAWGY